MAAKPLLECSFLIPLRRDRNLSDGKPHAKRAWKWLENELYEFEGATMANTTFSGWYLDRDTRTRERDTSWKYFVAVSRPGVERLRDLLRRACVVFAQKCIYLSVAGRVEFVQRESHESE